VKTYLAKVLFDGEKKLRDKFITIDEAKGEIIEVSDYSPNGEYEEWEYITPAFIDVHSHIGLARFGAPIGDEDVNEPSKYLNPLAFILDVYDLSDKGLKEAFSFGVVIASILPGSGNLVGGEGAVVYLKADTLDDAFIKTGGIKAALGENPKSFGNSGDRPGTRLGVFETLRKNLIEARNNLKLLNKRKKVWEELSPEEQRWVQILTKQLPLRVHVHTETDVMAFLRIAREFDINFTLEHLANVKSRRIFEILKDKGVRVNYGPLDSFPYKYELRDEDWRHLKVIREVGLDIAVMSDHPVILAQSLFVSLRYMLLCGYKEEEVIKAITYQAAKHLDLEGKGKVEKGYEANILLWRRNPFLLPSRPDVVVFKGKEYPNK